MRAGSSAGESYGECLRAAPLTRDLRAGSVMAEAEACQMRSSSWLVLEVGAGSPAGLASGLPPVYLF